MAETKLNRQQLQAIHHRKGPLLVIAGAGTGKTTVITKRIGWLLDNKLAKPDQILALTFTEKAAAEMEERIDKALPYGYTQMWVLTFHSFCDRILRDEGLHIGLSTGYKLLTSAASVSLLRRHLFDPELSLNYFRPLGNPNKFIMGILDHFDRLRDEDVTTDQYQSWVDATYQNIVSPEADQYRELSSIYTYFQHLKHQDNSLDFSDLISQTLHLFRSRPHLLTKYQQQFRHILVDEYQDTNFAQNKLVDMLVNSDRNLTVVADDDQSIYRWRGAAISNVIRFRDTYPKAKLIVLTKNYRSTQAILDSAYRLIQNNNPDRLETKEKINKRLLADIKNIGEQPELLRFPRLENEADGVAAKISQLLTEDPELHPGDIAILVRANAHSQPFLAALNRRGVDAKFLGPARLFDRPEIKELIAFLQVVCDPEDTASLFRVMSMDFFAIPPVDLITLTNLADHHNMSLLKLCRKPDLFPDNFSKTSQDSIDRLTELILQLISKSTKLTAGQILYEFLNASGILSAMLEYRQSIDSDTADNISQFFSQIKRYESENFDSSTRTVLDWMELTRETGGSPTIADSQKLDSDSVNILTLHSAKGLEFSVVFLVNLVVGRFPSLSRREQIPIPDALIKEDLPHEDFHLQEERRLFYVGLTRAKNRLFLTASDYYGDAKRIKKLSPFLAETVGDKALESIVPTVQQLPLSDWQQPQAKIQSQPKTHSIKVSYLSYSQIQAFLDCPLHYKAKYLLKIPSPSSPASSFGNTIHKTMKDYYQSLAEGARPNIIEIFTYNWSPDGYVSANHAQKYFDLGKRYLTEYVSANPFSSTPVVLEQPFNFRLGDLRIGGKIDRADILPDGTLEIIDYKTSVKKLDLKDAARDLQLSFYALAASSIEQPPFNREPGQVKLTLYYFNNQSSVSVIQTPEQLEAAKKEILTIASEIESSDFSCSRSIVCQGRCDYKILCDVYLNE